MGAWPAVEYVAFVCVFFWSFKTVTHTHTHYHKLSIVDINANIVCVGVWFIEILMTDVSNDVFGNMDWNKTVASS